MIEKRIQKVIDSLVQAKEATDPDQSRAFLVRAYEEARLLRSEWLEFRLKLRDLADKWKIVQAVFIGDLDEK